MINKTKKESKQALLAHREKLLQEIQYYQNKIANFQSDLRWKQFVDYESSDSENELQLFMNMGPSLSQLKDQQSSLRTCLQATQELTGITVLQSEITVLVQPPVVEREPQILEQGTWREVTAECRIDLVPFSITFYTYHGTKKFAPLLYRGLKVLPVKTAHEVELSKSVLPGVKTLSNAVEVLRSYADAYRSRRSTLARLADKYANNLYMEPLPDGGYLLKCANLLELSWRLENKRTPFAPFHHRLTFDLEYMDESYLKTIKQAHKQLSDPTIGTDERTLLLAKIINICLEAAGPNQELHESIDSDIEKKEKTVLESDFEDSKEIMAPPKDLPKKSKPKNVGDTVDNRKAVKRGSDLEGVASKKAKIDTNIEVDLNNQVIEKNTEMVEKSVTKKIDGGNEVASKNKDVQSKVNSNNKEKNENVTSTDKINKISNKNQLNTDIIENDVASKSKEVPENLKSKNKNVATSKNKENKPVNKVASSKNKERIEAKTSNTNINKNKEKNLKVIEKNVASVEKNNATSVNKEKNIENNNKELIKNKKDGTTNAETLKKAKTIEKNFKNPKIRQSKDIPNKMNEKNRKDSTITLDKNKKLNENRKNQNIQNENIVKHSAAIKNKESVSNIATKNKDDVQNVVTTKNKGSTQNVGIIKNKNGLQNVATKNKNDVTKNKDGVANVATKNKNGLENVAITKNKDGVGNVITKNKGSLQNVGTENKGGLQNIATTKNKNSTQNVGTAKNKDGLQNVISKKKIAIKTHNLPRKSIVKKPSNADLVKTKIPQKLGSISENNLHRKNPLRISPRKPHPNLKSSSDTNIVGKLTKPITFIPRLKKSHEK